MYNKIINPETNKLININSKKGIEILKIYINLLNKRGGYDCKKLVTTVNTKFSQQKLKKSKKKVLEITDNIKNKEYSYYDIEKLVIGPGVITIDVEGFSHCRNLKEIDMTMAIDLKIIGEGAFYDCNSLENLLIPSSCKINKKAFKLCSNLKVVIVEDLFLNDENAEILEIKVGDLDKKSHSLIDITKDHPFYCCDKNLRVYNGKFFTQTSKHLDYCIDITQLKTEKDSKGKSFDLCKNSAYIQLLNKQILFYKSNDDVKYGLRHLDTPPLNDTLFITFAGNTANIWSQIRRSTSYSCNLLYFFDYKNVWYKDSMEKINSIIYEYTSKYKHIKKIIYQGTSMGAYAALYLSSLYTEKIQGEGESEPGIKLLEENNELMGEIHDEDEEDELVDELPEKNEVLQTSPEKKKIICLAFSPQTFNKNKVVLFNKKIRTRLFPDNVEVIDIRKHIEENEINKDIKRYVFFGYNECLKMDNHWMDTLMAGHLIGLKNTALIVTPQNIHFQILCIF